MKYVLIDNKNVVLHISDTIGYQENGNILVDNDSLAYAKILVKEIVELEEVPAKIKPYKYCYTVEGGFVENPDYVEPVDESKQMEQILANLDYLVAMNL